MKANVYLIFLVFLFMGCSNHPPNDLFKTTDGEYASKMGRFVAAYPSKPFHYIAQRKLDDQSDLHHEFHLIRSTFGDRKVFSVEYFEMDEDFQDHTSTKEIFDLLKKDIQDFLEDVDFVLDYTSGTNIQGFKGFFFSFQPNAKLKRQMPKARAEGKVVIRENRVYYMYYFGIIDRQADKFLESFRFTK